jgi:hypothetical protein
MANELGAQAITQTNRTPLSVQWMNARAERKLDIASALARQILERRPQERTIHRGEARLLEVQGRSEQAFEHWAALRCADPHDFEAAFHLARAAVAGGVGLGAAAAQAAPGANDVFRAALVGALAEPAPALEGDFKHIAICGVAFCGSTLVDRVLGGLPGVASIGESHWLTKVRADNEYRGVDMSQPVETARWVPCTVCRQKCEVLTSGFRRSLAADNANWYRKVAARLDTRILVSADKNVPTLLEKDPLLELSALVIFKSPEQAWRSKLDKLPADRDAAFYEAECRAYLNVWTLNYRSRLDHFRPRGPVAWLNFDAFTAAPEPLLQAVCDRLELPFDAGVLQRTRPGHAIGGNGGSMRRLRANDYEVVIERLPDPALEPSHAKIIAEDAGAREIWREMLALHEDLAP